MRHPALTRFFAAFLAVVSVITLISGGICIKKAADDREKQNTNTARLSQRTAEAKELRAELDAMPLEFSRQSAAYDEAKARYDSEKLSYRKDLSIYTATEAALKQGQEKLDEGYAALRMGWIAHDNGEKALDEAEAQFLPGYEQYLAAKRQTEEGRKQLEEAEKLKESLPDLAFLRAALDALKASKTDIDASLDEIQNTIDNPPIDPESGQVDSDAQRMQLMAELFVLSGRLAAVQAKITEQYTPEEIEQALAPTIAALSEQTDVIINGDLDPEALLAAAEQIIASGKSLSGAFDEALEKAEQTLTLLESLPELRAQLDAAEAALKESEPLLLEAKAGFDEGREKLNEAKQTLIFAEAQLIAGKKELEEKQAEQQTTREDLDRRKATLEEETDKLEQMLLEVEDYRKKKDRFGNLRYALLADDGIALRVRAGEDLIEGTESELAQRRVDTQKEFSLRLAAAVAMIAASVFGAFTVTEAFRARRRAALPIGAALSFAAAAAAEGLSLYAGRGVIYTAFFVGLFAAAVLALNLKKSIE